MTDQEIIDLINLTLAEEFELNMEDMKPEALIFENDNHINYVQTVQFQIIEN